MSDEHRRLDEDLVFPEVTKEDIAQARGVSKLQARSMLSLYVNTQKNRVRAALKQSAFDRLADVPLDSDLDEDFQEPRLLESARNDLKEVEKKMAKGLAAYARAQPLCVWAMSNVGVGELIAAELFIEIDFHRCCCAPYRGWKGKKRDAIPAHDCPGLVTAGHIWSFAGLTEESKENWKRGERRPFNARLKSTCFRLGESFKKNCPSGKVLGASVKELSDMVREEFRAKKLPEPRGKELTEEVRRRRDLAEKKAAKLDDPDRLYCKLYLEKKRQLTERNERGEMAEAAHRMLEASSGKAVSAEMRKTWEAGRRQAYGIDLMAMRYAVKIFLSHFHQVGREMEFGEAVRPWAIAHGGHCHYIPPPNWPMKE